MSRPGAFDFFRRDEEKYAPAPPVPKRRRPAEGGEVTTTQEEEEILNYIRRLQEYEGTVNSLQSHIDTQFAQIESLQQELQDVRQAEEDLLQQFNAYSRTSAVKEDLSTLQQHNEHLRKTLAELKTDQQEQLGLVNKLREEASAVQRNLVRAQQDLQRCEKKSNRYQKAYVDKFASDALLTRDYANTLNNQDERRAFIRQVRKASRPNPGTELIDDYIEPFYNSLTSTAEKRTFLLGLQKLFHPDRCSVDDSDGEFEARFPGFRSNLDAIRSNLPLYPDMCSQVFQWLQTTKAFL